MNLYLNETTLLDYNSPLLQKLIHEKGWNAMDLEDKILHIYNYVRDDIAFGYNKEDAIPASQVQKDGYGQCNTKGILFMALLRGVNVPCRMHGFTIDKKLQKGAIKGCAYELSPKEILHSWVEVCYKDMWLNLEGFILDIYYLTKLQKKFSQCEGSFCGYGVATDNFKNPQIYWNENNTYIQKEGIVKDFGVYDGPDELFSQHSQALGWIKKFLFRYVIRHRMNKNIQQIRNGSS